MATKTPNPIWQFSSKSPILLRVRTGIRLTFRGLCSPTRTPTTFIYKVVYPPARLWGLMGFNIALEDVQGQAKSPFKPITSKIVWRTVRRTSTFFKTVCIFLKYVRRLEASEGGPLWFWSLWPLMSPILGLSWCLRLSEPVVISWICFAPSHFYIRISESAHGVHIFLNVKKICMYVQFGVLDRLCAFTHLQVRLWSIFINLLVFVTFSAKNIRLDPSRNSPDYLCLK